MVDLEVKANMMVDLCSKKIAVAVAVAAYNLKWILDEMWCASERRICVCVRSQKTQTHSNASSCALKNCVYEC